MDEKVTQHEPAACAEPSGARKGLAFLKRNGSRRSPVAIGLTALIVASLGYVSYRVISPKDQSIQKPGRRGAFGGPPPVAVATVARSDIKIVRHGLLGSVTPIANVTVKTQLGGYLTEIGFKEGQYVQKGDFLAQIDPRPYEAQKAQYEGQLLRDQGLLNQARDDLRRYQSLKKLDSIAHQQAENQVWIVKQYEGSVKADQALVDNQTLNLTYARIVSPIAGRVGLRKVDAGSYVTTQDAIALVAQIDPISVIFGVPEDYIPDILRAQKKNGALEVIAFDRSDTKQLAIGRLHTLDNTIDPSTGMVSARAEFENRDEKLYPNQFVNIHLLVEVREQALTLPKTAIRKGAAGHFVYKVTGENRVVMQPVIPAGGENFDDVAGYNDGRIEILQGVAESDRIVVEGADRLREGAEVTIADGGDREHRTAADASKPPPPHNLAPEAQPSEKRFDPERARERRPKRQPTETQ
ncbi:efflux RND transporter periplasmic adaptor subunit [Methylosinus sp. H3A]|uniref:efflux RND transporter periplasmic adaptor subunit n=1 Tax=Methylosinus sp. H3A TaxID=2785786 RepID=UPI0018C1DA4E|nr:efflux RND transporter periplasmic adaptor subunit [Methylosinus sp. H3A]MBG0808395.1 efflux RND transporter periplasmic adaptor subunit [Methylosinus sp. H3A]